MSRAGWAAQAGRSPVDADSELIDLIREKGATRAEAREIMRKLGYGPDKKLEVKVSTRNVASYRDPAVILIDQLKEIYIDGELEPVDTSQWFPRLMS